MIIQDGHTTAVSTEIKHWNFIWHAVHYVEVITMHFIMITLDLSATRLFSEEGKYIKIQESHHMFADNWSVEEMITTK